MLFWIKFFSLVILMAFVYLSLYLNNFFSLLLISELILILIFYIFSLHALLFNINWIFGFNFILVLIGSLDITLSLLLLFI